MSVTSLGAYEFEPRDALARYRGKQLVYINWERHRMFSRPFVIAVSPETPFRTLVDDYISSYAYHPDYERIDWDKVVWRNSEEVFTPNFDKSLAANGIGHKDLIRFTTPGLDGLNGTGY